MPRKKKKELRNIPTKNYIIAIIMFLGLFALLYYLTSWHKVVVNYEKDTPVIRGTLPEITSDDLEHFLQENPNAIVYLCTANAKKCRNFEDKFKIYVEENTLEEVITYLNLSDVDTLTFTDKFNAKYKYKKHLKNNYPAFIAFSEGKVVDMLQGKENKEIKIKEVKDFIEDNNEEE